MNITLRQAADRIINQSIEAVKPDAAVIRALSDRQFPGRVFCVATGKAAWQMAKAARGVLGDKITKGIVITKYGHVKGDIPGFELYEAGHPVPDENSFSATEKAMTLVKGLRETDTVLFLLSGGGSALFEKPLIPGEELSDLTRQLLSSGADIVEMNTVRKRVSAVKGGKFATLCQPAKVFAIVLSDILGDPLDMIASGPVTEDSSTCEQALAIVKKYSLRLSPKAMELMNVETPKKLSNVTSIVTGSVRELTLAASKACMAEGFTPTVLSDMLCCQAREAGSFMASILQSHKDTKVPLAFIAGGETVVRLTGSGKGGRNQELALGAAEGIKGMSACVFSVGSDGTDGPTDAAGGYVDGDSLSELAAAGLTPYEVLENNDAYTALGKIGGLIFTGPTGTNVNDVSVGLIVPESGEN